MKHSFSYYYGAILGGAIGDALGAPVEFMNYEQIEDIIGPDGVKDFIIPPEQKYALITDDTQLTLFTAEGLLRSITRAHRKNKERTLQDTSTTVHRAYLRWLYTQGLRTVCWSKKDYDGWLVKVGRLHAYREPGVTCLTALGKGIMGTLDHAVNESLTCGCVMRVMPVGLVESEDRVFDIATRLAAITHGNPTSYLSAGTFAYIIKQIIKGQEIEGAVSRACQRLKQETNHEELLYLINKAVLKAREKTPSRENMELIGKGFLAHEVLAMAIYAALSYPQDYTKAVLLAVNHSGDSDSIAAITGSIVGAALGYEAIPEAFRLQIELSKEMNELARDLEIYYEEGERWLEKYPAW